MSTRISGHGAPSSSTLRLGTLALALVLLAPLATSIARSADGASAAARGPAPVLTAQDAATLRHMLQDWFVAFTAKNYAAIDQYFAAPYTAIGNQTVVLPNMLAVRNLWRRTREHLNGTGYSHTEAVALRVIPRSATLALLNIHWRRLNKDGTTMSEGSEFYFASKRSGKWHFNGGMSQELAEFDAVGQAVSASPTLVTK